MTLTNLKNKLEQRKLVATVSSFEIPEAHVKSTPKGSACRLFEVSFLQSFQRHNRQRSKTPGRGIGRQWQN